MTEQYVILVFASPLSGEEVEEVVGPFRSEKSATNWVAIYGDDEKFYRVKKMEAGT